MIEHTFEGSRAFQLRLLAALVRDPERFLDVVRPEYFNYPFHTEIARVVHETFENKELAVSPLSRSTLLELLRKKIDRHSRREILRPCRAEAKKLFKYELSDEDVLYDQARQFARTREYLEFLVHSERDITNGRFDAVHRRLEKLRQFGSNTSGASPNWEDFTLRKEESEPVSWVVQGLIPERAITVFSGKRGAYKTYLGMAIAKAVAQGQPFANLPVQQMKVFYLNRDNPRTIFMKRMCEELRLGPEDEDFAHWSLWHPKGEPPKFGQGSPILEALAKTYEPLFIVDSLSRFHTAEENSATEMGKVFEEIRRLNNFGATFLILHNLGKTKDRGPRGSSSIADAVDMLVEVAVRRGGSRPSDRLVSLTIEKDRAEGKEGTTLLFRPQNIICGRKTKLFRFREVTRPGETQITDTAQDLLEYVKQHPGLNQSKLVKGFTEEFGIAVNKSRRLLKDAVGEGDVKVQKGGKHNESLYFAA
jgi:hypothetical protein